ncbi:CinA family nicotinamide mononucleotide deamidase-related protein [Flavobacterium sp. F-380]|uniref:CinA-like protein n=1 Tax=Flavobacterium kayseriense TaxID=2764714 RepID=A0ABR7J9Z8_9FLAO|nr:CinA family nicotinamide mononucleotide deamidase-related protein [Flavobacterium kayseriense]MBC5842315.1 CinA family nicotinamide mononucleotide deamidase-related protein [Flavobacterium kayseriense]MBC5848845.1 CinA family nicotinamide mononucleotide deamidase-related protein [Flavobacterium kayseriense]
MKATIITIGDEILIGQIVDTNSAFIAKSLDKIGVEVNEMISITDDKNHILDTFTKLQNNVDLVLITGGLGPTKDDVTKKTFCDYFEDELIVDQKVLEHVTELIEGIFKRPINQMNKDQALVPSKCTILHNAVGTAPGMWMKKENTVYVSLPGVPYEMKYLVENEIIPKVVREYERPYILHKTVLTHGQGESLVAERIEDWENNLPEFIKLAYLPAPGRVRLRLSARGKDKGFLERALEEYLASLDAIINDIIVGYEEANTIEVVLGELFTKQQKTIATAESCTGGSIASLLSSVPGSSAYFRGSVVSYATDVKIDLLNIPPELITEFSVVSAEVASAMALSVKKLMKTDYAIATTGNAGPSKGDSNAEIGAVFIAVATPNGVFVEEFNFGQPREKVIDRALYKSLEMLYKEILKKQL